MTALTKEPVTVVCMKWGRKYGPEYVNHLFSGLGRFLHRPFRFICFTDDGAGIDAGVEILPLPEVRLLPGAPERGWRKLAVFAKEFHDITGWVLFLDLDVILAGDLDAFFEHPGDFCVIRDWHWKKKCGNTSVFRFKAGAFPHLLENWERDAERISQQYRNEQEYVTAEVGVTPVFWPVGWCRSFKADCIPKGLAKLWRAPQKPEDAKIIVFHGNPNPPEAIVGKSGKWYRPIQPAPWVADLWK